MRAEGTEGGDDGLDILEEEEVHPESPLNPPVVAAGEGTPRPSRKESCTLKMRIAGVIKLITSAIRIFKVG